MSIYTEIKEKLLESLKNEKAPWTSSYLREILTAKSGNTGKPYSYCNQLLLAMSGFRGGAFYTFNQIKKNGWTLRKGSHGGKVTFYMPVEEKLFRKTRIEEQPAEEELEEQNQEPKGCCNNNTFKAILKGYYVFNESDIEGRLKEFEEEKRPENFDNIIKKYLTSQNIEIKTENGCPCYVPKLDVVKIPEKKYFINDIEYLFTIAHEVIHSTGHEKRLNRFRLYETPKTAAFEELVAEIGAAFLCAHCGIDYSKAIKNNAAYCRHYAKIFEEQNERFFVMAAAKAQKAVEFILAA